MAQAKHKIPLLLRIVRVKYSRPVIWIDNLFRNIKKNKKFKGIPKKILFLRIDRIGDAIVTLPFLRDLKLNYPALQIHVIASKRNYRYFTDAHYIDRLFEYHEDIEFDYPDSFKRFFFIRQVSHLLSLRLSNIFNKGKHNILAQLKSEKYDAVIDLTGDKRCILLSNLVSKYNAGARVMFFSIFYKYRMVTTWVDINDRDFIYRKFESIIYEAFNMKLVVKDKSLPFKTDTLSSGETKGAFDIVMHLSNNNIRALSTVKEIELLNTLSVKKICLIDYGESYRLNKYREYFKDNRNISFNSYTNMEEIRSYLSGAKLLITYDGGHSHYFSQFIKTLVIFGSTSPYLWKPFEFENYKLLKKWDNGVIAEKSDGQYGHVIIFCPVWCNPCFDIGCKTKPCLNNIQPEYVIEIINSEL